MVAEACTHHRVEDDIGTVKIPRWLTQHIGGNLDFKWASGVELPPDIEDYKLIVHCGACMINRKEMLHRLMQARQAHVTDDLSQEFLGVTTGVTFCGVKMGIPQLKGRTQRPE